MQQVSLYSGFIALWSGFSSALSEAEKAFLSICIHLKVMLEIIFNYTNTTLHGSRALMMQLRAVNPIFYWDEQVLQAEHAWRHCTLHTQFFYKTQQDRFMSGVIPLPPENFHLGKLVLEESSVPQLFTRGQFFFYFLYSTSFSWSSFSSDQQDTTRSTSSSPSKKDNTNLLSVQKIRDRQAITIQTLLTGPLWKWFWLESHQTVLFLAAWIFHTFPLLQAICCASQGGLSQTRSLTLL